MVWEKEVNKIKNILGNFQLGKVKNKYEVIMFDSIKKGWDGVFQDWDNEFSSGYIMGIKSAIIPAKIIEDKRVKNSIFI